MAAALAGHSDSDLGDVRQDLAGVAERDRAVRLSARGGPDELAVSAENASGTRNGSAHGGLGGAVGVGERFPGPQGRVTSHWLRLVRGGNDDLAWPLAATGASATPAR